LLIRLRHELHESAQKELVNISEISGEIKKNKELILVKKRGIITIKLANNSVVNDK
jgi:hypothetical protein